MNVLKLVAESNSVKYYYVCYWEIIMKKIENWLLWPILVLIFASISKYGEQRTDIHWNDTFYVIDNNYITGSLLVWLLIVFFLLKFIRHRHHTVHTQFAIAYMVLTVLLFTLFWGSSFLGGGSPAGYSDSQIDKLIFYNNLRLYTAFGLLLVQVIFLLYFIVQMLKKSQHKQ